MPAVPKPEPPYRSKEYLAFARSYSCPCGHPPPNEAHHAPIGLGDETGWNVKVTDLQAVPRCLECHDKEGNAKGRGKAKIREEIIVLQIEYIKKKLSKLGILNRIKIQMEIIKMIENKAQ